MLVAFVLALACSATAFAAVYIAKQAKMSVFSGRIEQTSSSADDSKMVLKTTTGMDIGQRGNITQYDDAVFPILSNVTGCTILDNQGATFETRWNDEDGKAPPTAQRFVLAAENGDIDDVSYEIVVSGKTPQAALRFGVTYSYYSEEDNTIVTTTRVHDLQPSTENLASSEKVTLGDGNILEGEEIVFEITVWADADTLAQLGEYENDVFNVEVVFSTPEE